ncbi:phage head-tail adapter protein [Bacillus cereus]|nr:phage head-tail adapter protein [Bacillus cereus]MEB9569676.1 phage head-tail adapter protein [Bacillus cereus]
MVIKQHRKTYNDGIVSVQKLKTIRNANKKVIGQELAEVMRLRFSEMSARDTDIELCKGLGKKLDMKIETLYPPKFKEHDMEALTVVLRGAKYSVIKTDRFRTSLYLYLQKVGGSSESD